MEKFLIPLSGQPQPIACFALVTPSDPQGMAKTGGFPVPGVVAVALETSAKPRGFAISRQY